MGSQTHEELQILNLSSFSLENLESKFQSLAHVLHNALWHTVTWGQLFHQEAINYFHSCHKDGNWMWGIETESLKYFPWKYCSYSLLPNLHTVRQKCNCRTVNVTEVPIAATFQEQSQQYWATTYYSGNPSLHTGMKDTITNVSSWKGLRMWAKPTLTGKPPQEAEREERRTWPALAACCHPAGSYKPRRRHHNGLVKAPAPNRAWWWLKLPEQGSTWQKPLSEVHHLQRKSTTKQQGWSLLK